MASKKRFLTEKQKQKQKQKQNGDISKYSTI